MKRVAKNVEFRKQQQMDIADVLLINLKNDSDFTLIIAGEKL